MKELYKNKLKKNLFICLKYSVIVIIIITIGCSDDNYTTNLPINNAEPIKILAIGNSFSEDGLQYVYDLAKADNKKIIIGNLFYPKCSLAQHWSFIRNKSAVYDFQKNMNGTFTHSYNSSFLETLRNENWDIITVQQYSGDAGLINTYFPYLDSIINFIKLNSTNSTIKIALHQTWAYPKYNTEKVFNIYNNNQEVMYHQIVNVIDSAAFKVNISKIIPSGTAIQNARCYFGDNLNRDNVHLSIPLGRYIASCTWFETIFAISSVGNCFIPKGLSYKEAHIAQEAAHNATSNHYKLTNCSHN